MISAKAIFAPRKKTVKGELNVVKSMFKQQLAIAKSYWTSFIILILIPIIFTLIPILIGKSISPNYEANFEAKTGATNAEAYLVLGTVIWTLTMGILWDFGVFLREEQLIGTLDSLMLSPVSRYTIAIGRASFSSIFNIFFTMTSAIIGLAIYSPEIFRTSTFSNLILSFFILILSTFAMIGVSMMLGSLVIRFKEVESLINGLQWIFGTIMGVFYSIALLPWPIRIFSILLPASWGLNDIRAIMLSSPPMLAIMGLSFGKYTLLVDIVLMILIGVIWSFSGLKIFEWVLENTKKKEGLSKY